MPPPSDDVRKLYGGPGLPQSLAPIETGPSC